MSTPEHRTRTLVLATVLHAFTHVYQVALVPLFFRIQEHYALPGVGQATLLMTVMFAAYFLPSYPIGILADRFSRKKLLAFGLAVNGLGFIGLAVAPNYATALVCVIIAGLGGSFFHPSATALIAGLFPGTTGRALGIIGIGASVGFFFGPIYTGWRAFHHDWRWPVLELGIAGLVFAGLFVWLAQEERRAAAGEPQAHMRQAEPMFPTPALWLMFLCAAFAFSLRDFAGSSMATLGSLFLQKARGFDLKQAGTAIGCIFIASAISNPLFGHLSDRARLTWGGAVLLLAAAFVAVFPLVPSRFVVPALLAYGFFLMSNYPIIEAALMESVPNAVRGRVFGLFITVGGLVGNVSHWLMGRWVEGFGARASEVRTYFPLYGFLAALLLASLLGLPCLRAIRRREVALGETVSAPVPHSALRTRH